MGFGTYGDRSSGSSTEGTKKGQRVRPAPSISPSYRPMRIEPYQQPSVPRAVKDRTVTVSPGDNLLELKLPSRVDLTYVVGDRTVTVELDPQCLAAGKYEFNLSCDDEVREAFEESGIVANSQDQTSPSVIEVVDIERLSDEQLGTYAIAQGLELDDYCSIEELREELICQSLMGPHFEDGSDEEEHF